jgi:16S rRNA (cytosine967-C5)-methyltransferase
VINTPRGMTVEILNRVALTDAYAEPLLDACLSSPSLTNVHDRRLLTELVYGVLRYQGHLDWIIAKYYRGNFQSLDIFVKNILRASLYQLIYTSRIPDFAVVDEAVKLTKMHHRVSSGLVNAILRNYLRQRDDLVYPRMQDAPREYIAIMHSHPRWLVEHWLQCFGVDKTVAICAANNEIPPITLRVNGLTMTREEAQRELANDNIEAEKTIFSPQGLIIAKHGPSLRETTSFQKGRVILQDEASQLIGLLAAAQPEEQVLDICAGRGVKTTHLAEIMQNRGKIIAVDINAGKLAALRELAERLGIGIVETRVGDARAEVGSEWQGRFDRVLVDAPCSGLGTLRRNPEIKWRLSARDLTSCSDLQKQLLASAAPCLRKGGTLVYSVCTVTPEENEAVVNDFLQHHRNFHLALPPASINRVLINERGFFQTHTALHGTDSFFGAVMVKKEA